jgi:Glycosyltransferase
MGPDDAMARRFVLHVITGLETGGAEMMLYKVLATMRGGAFTGGVVSLLGGGTIRPRVERLGVPVDSLAMDRGTPSVAALFRLRRLMGGMRPDLVQGWMYHGNLAAMLAPGMGGRRVPVVWNVRQTLYDPDKESRLTRWVIRANAWLSSRASVIVYNSRTSAKQHEAFGFDPSRTLIIPNGFDTGVFHPDAAARAAVRHELGVGDEEFLFGLVGRYHPMKDHRTFLDAAAILCRERAGVRFLLVGTNVDEANPELRGMIAERGLDPHVILLGERHDTPRLTTALDVATSSSAWGEGFANVVGEAMSCGVPCVVTDIGDSAWIVGDTGLVVGPRDPAALATAWAKLADLGREQLAALGARARERVVTQFALGPVVQQYEDLYERLIAQGEV